MSYGIIYKITNLVNGKSYIGQTIQREFKRRFNRFIRETNKGVRYHPLLSAIRKYGVDSFILVIETNADNSDQLNWLEDEAIRRLNTLYPNGYNLKFGGASGKPSDLSRRKMSESAKLHISKLSDDERKNLTLAAQRSLSLDDRKRNGRLMVNTVGLEELKKRGRLLAATLTEEQRRVGGENGGKKNIEKWKELSKEEQKIIIDNMNKNLTHEDRINNGIKGALVTSSPDYRLNNSIKKREWWVTASKEKRDACLKGLSKRQQRGPRETSIW